MKLKALLLLAAAGAVSACAQTPGAIAPVSMGNAFQGMTCPNAQLALSEERRYLTGLEQQQRGAVAGDAVGVFLFAVPVSSLTGADVSGEIAASKGKVVALENRLLTC